MTVFTPVSETPRSQQLSQVELFKIARNKNGNMISYNAIVSSGCSLYSETPFYAYWKMYEKGIDEVEELNWIEQKFAYGIWNQVKYSEREGIFRTRALKEVQIQVALEVSPQGCTSQTFINIENTKIQLDSVYIFAKKQFLVSSPRVKYIDFVGKELIADSTIIKRLTF